MREGAHARGTHTEAIPKAHVSQEPEKTREEEAMVLRRSFEPITFAILYPRETAEKRLFVDSR
jgi:hypothetical protein